MALEKPLGRCDALDFPITFLGDYTFSDVQISVEFRLPSTNSTAVLGVRVEGLGCSMGQAKGVFFWIEGTGNIFLSDDSLKRNILANSSIFLPPQKYAFYPKFLLRFPQNKLIFGGPVQLSQSKLRISYSHFLLICR